ncbi:hypothetical protein RMSM_04192 [Rhodopirellula maiorica SM1]|uniref:Uncharacterized protein n=1 Tax=Rhodopirellula maiorica SM1 TaxID=1265738 RepID=M5RU22_9BACT|nr:hypothetical protein RMSM_04192 [Rhodopirellula maiorica SM1]
MNGDFDPFSDRASKGSESYEVVQLILHHIASFSKLQNPDNRSSLAQATLGTNDCPRRSPIGHKYREKNAVKRQTIPAATTSSSGDLILTIQIALTRRLADIEYCPNVGTTVKPCHMPIDGVTITLVVLYVYRRGANGVQVNTHKQTEKLSLSVETLCGLALAVHVCYVFARNFCDAGDRTSCDTLVNDRDEMYR